MLISNTHRPFSVFASLLALTMILVGCSGTDAAETSTTIPTTLATTSTLLTTTTTSVATTSTTVADTDVELDAPDSWVEVAPSEYELPAVAGGLAPTMVQVDAEPMGDLDETVTEAKSALQEIMRDFEVLSEGERQVGEYAARFLEYAGVDQGNVARYEVWIARKDSLVHVIYSASVEAYTATKAEFEKTLVDSLG